jgi:hypothetical protein
VLRRIVVVFSGCLADQTRGTMEDLGEADDAGGGQLSIWVGRTVLWSKVREVRIFYEAAVAYQIL